MRLIRGVMKKASCIVLTVVILVALYTAALTVAFRINDGRLLKNGREAAALFDRDYLSVFFEKEEWPLYHGSQLDRFTDRIIFNMAAGGWAQDPAETWPNYLNMAMSMSGYSRYWHGYVVLLRPLLVFFDFFDIQRILYLTFTLLSAGVLLSIGQRLGKTYALVFAFANVLIAYYCIPMSFQFFSVFLIMLLAALVLLNCSRLFERDDVQLVFFTAVGSLTSFMDLLTAPLVTLGFPLAILLMMTNRSQRIARGDVYPIIQTVGCSASWAVGYAGTWASKWVLGGWILKRDILSDAVSSFVTRTTGRAEEAVLYTANLSLELNLAMIRTWEGLLIALLCVLLCLGAVGLYRRRDRRRALLLAASLAAIAAYPYLWYAIVTNHSQIHFWFTYRAQFVSIVAGMWAMLSCFFEKEHPERMRQIDHP